ncbi:MAG TPA: oligosaccharide flippase family protein [Candidatus Sulfotelmatobacter sp.]|jgi:O-antigen/teichoic acid export membrane protein|nr:oligosaccharide flippase family protein [Candidatus Sulfotelmatobacter sp.]
MKQNAKRIIQHPLILGSGIVVIGNLFANFFNFLFNLFMSRTLSVTDYGVLASVMSLIAFPLLVSTSLGPIVVQFAGNYFATGNFPLLRGLYIKMTKLLFIIAFIFTILFFCFISAVSNFFHIENKLILFVTDAILFFAVINVINISFIQAKLAFVFQVLINLLNSVSKFILGVIFVLLGYSVSGAVFAILIGLVSAYLFSFIQLKFIFDRKITVPHIETKELISYGIPASITLMGLTSFISTDIMLVKHFFDPHQAGLYAGLSLIGRVIFFVSAPIGSVMFPIIVQKYSKNENFTRTFNLSLLLVFLPSLFITIFYMLFPKFAILFFLKREEYLAVSNLITPFAIFIVLFSLLSIIANFYLSIKKTEIYIPILLGAIVQAVLIYFYHQSFQQIILISLTITLILVLILLLHYHRVIRRIKKVRDFDIIS